MPEGPEIRTNSNFINTICKDKNFHGTPEKSSVYKSPAFEFKSTKYSITSNSRGKELSLSLQCQEDPNNRVRLIFRFGMSGKFVFTSSEDVPKHAHLKFSCIVEGKTHFLSFVDTRRFGSWHVMETGWGENRGPDIVDEYDAFRKNVLDNLDESVFGRAICECMLNQEYFNGIGNYLRAEVLYRQVVSYVCDRQITIT